MRSEDKMTKKLLCVRDRAFVRYVDTVQELANILVPYSADTLDGRS